MDPSARIGTTIHGKWKIERLLGSGGFASVYAATHRAGKRVALKVLHPALSASAEVRRRFLKEAYAANSVEHPGVVGVSDDDVTEDGCAFLVMDLLDGESVDARRKRMGGQLPLDDALLIAEQALDVIAAAHDKGIIHRDLKPENLFWTAAGQIRVLDFGIARFREPGDESTSTQTGMTMGSPAFMAPEQARGRWAEVDARTDVYAMGATMMTLLTGRLVHGKLNLNEALIAAATTPAPRLASLLPNVPESVADVVDRALAFDKASRWEGARAMAAAVRKARSHIGILGSATMPLTPAHFGGTGTQGAAPALSVAQQTTPLGTGPQAPAMMAPTTEIAPPGALPGPAQFALQPNLTPPGARLAASGPGANVTPPGAVGLTSSGSGPNVTPPGAVGFTSSGSGPSLTAPGNLSEIGAIGGPGGSTPSAVVTTQPPRRNRGVGALFGGGALLVIGILGLSLWRLGQRPQDAESAITVPTPESVTTSTQEAPVVSAPTVSPTPIDPPAASDSSAPIGTTSSVPFQPDEKPTATITPEASPSSKSAPSVTATKPPPSITTPKPAPAKPTTDPLLGRPRKSKSGG